jgi:hypothetical protein
VYATLRFARAPLAIGVLSICGGAAIFTSVGSALV